VTVGSAGTVTVTVLNTTPPGPPVDFTFEIRQVTIGSRPRLWYSFKHSAIYLRMLGEV